MKWYLDFGHGGKDPGAIGYTNLKERDIALKIGMIIKENLENAYSGKSNDYRKENESYRF